MESEEIGVVIMYDMGWDGTKGKVGISMTTSLHMKLYWEVILERF